MFPEWFRLINWVAFVTLYGILLRAGYRREYSGKKLSGEFDGSFFDYMTQLTKRDYIPKLSLWPRRLFVAWAVLNFIMLITVVL